MREDDAAAACLDLLDTALQSLAQPVLLRSSGMEDQQDGTGAGSGSYAFGDVDWRSASEDGPEPHLRGTLSVELHLRPHDQLVLAHHTVASQLRGTLEGATVPVYGTTSGTPLDLQGALLLLDFRWQVLQSAADEITCQADIEIMER